jgi:hypothetical protein|tara:strand:+ start:101 stop:334 length:234 start_codon:yes stop_codon:yes gene_type:complete
MENTLPKKAIKNSELIVQNVFKTCEEAIEKYGLNPLMFGHRDGCADNLAENREFYIETLTPYEWRCFNVASYLIDKV